MLVFDEVELSGPLPLVLNKTAVPGTTLSVSAASASDAPIEQKIKAMKTRGLNAPDSGDVFFRI